MDRQIDPDLLEIAVEVGKGVGGVCVLSSTGMPAAGRWVAHNLQPTEKRAAPGHKRL